MTGLAGIWDAKSDTEALRRDLGHMQRVLQTPGEPAPAEIAATPGAACLALGGEAAIARDGGIWLAFDGELYDRGPLLQRVGREAAGVIGDAELCLRLLLSQGDAFVERLNGQFNLAVYSETSRVLSIATDRFGYRPLFYAHRGSRFLFATALKAIVAVLDTAPTVDGIGLLQSMRRGWPLGERTYLEEVRVADPGTWLRIEGGRVSRKRYFRFRYRAGSEAPSVRSYAEGLAEVLRLSVQRRIMPQERVAIPLSGGLDSRALLFSTGPECRPVVAYTFGSTESYDVVYAQQLARIAAVPHRHYPYQPGYLGRLLPTTVWFTEGLTAFAEVTFSSVAFHNQIAAEADVLLYGHCGDCLTGAHLPVSVLLRRSRTRLIEDLVRQYNRVPEAALRRVFNRGFYRRHIGELPEAMRQTFEEIEGDSIADILDVWDVENRQRRGTFISNAVDRSRFRVRSPFLDNDVVDYLSRAPVSLRVLQVGYKTMLTQVFREAGHVPWAYTGRRLRTSLIGDFTQHAFNYARRRLSPRRTDPRLFRDLRVDVRSDEALLRTLSDFAGHPDFPGDVFDRDGWRSTVDDELSGAADLTHLVIMLATFATAWRLFLFEQPSACPAEISAV